MECYLENIIIPNLKTVKQCSETAPDTFKLLTGTEIVKDNLQSSNGPQDFQSVIRELDCEGTYNSLYFTSGNSGHSFCVVKGPTEYFIIHSNSAMGNKADAFYPRLDKRSISTIDATKVEARDLTGIKGGCKGDYLLFKTQIPK